MKCRFCDADAVATFTMSEGCVCFPDDREQALCCQHADRATPIGDMVLKEILILPLWEWYRGTAY